MSHAPTAGPSAPRKSIGLDAYSPVTNLELYTTMSCIGKGSFGVIHKVARKSDGVVLALKELDYSKMPPKDRKQMLQEVSILDSLQHENVVQLVDKILDKAQQKLYIVMEYCGGGDLGHIIGQARRTGKTIQETTIWSYFVQLVMALHHCHWPEERERMRSSDSAESVGGVPVGRTARRSNAAGQVLHRDLKPENIFLDESKEMVKLGDFGLSKNLGHNTFTSTYVGTPLYMPPEILQENKYDTKSDIWSLGCLIFELCTLSSPFQQAKTQPELLQMVNSGKIPPMPAYLSKELRDAVRSMLHLQPSRRPSTAELLSLDKMRTHRDVHLLNIKVNEVLEQKKRVTLRDERLRAREQALLLREQELVERERKFRSDYAAAKEEYERFLQARDAWEKERDGEMRSGRSSEGEMQRPRLSDAGSDVLTSPSVQASRIPRRSSMLGAKAPLGDIPPVSNLSLHGMAPRAQPDYYSKLPVPAAGTPVRSLHKTKSLSNIGQENRSPGGAEPMDLSTPFKQPQRQSPQRASVSSPRDLRKMMAMSSDDTVTTRPAYTQAFAQRPTLQHAATTQAVEQTRPTTRPALQTHTSSYAFREMGTPAKWSPSDPDAPSPFIKRELPRPSDPPATLRGAFAKRPSSAATGGNDLRRQATMANARTGMVARRSNERMVEDAPSPLRSRAMLAQQDAIRAMNA